MEIAIGLLIGLAIGTTGIGGGTLTAPALVLILGYQPRTAVATALVYAACVKFWAVIAYFIRKQVRFRVLAFLLLGGVPGAILGTTILDGLTIRDTSDWVLCGVGAVVLISSLSSLINFGGVERSLKCRERLLPFVAFPIGLESGFSSSGSGALGTVLLLRLTTLTPPEVVGTGLAFGIGICGIAGIMQAMAGHCDTQALVRMIPAGMVGSMIGAVICGHIPANFLRKSLLFCVAGTGLTLLIKGLNGIL
ncbi:MAG TPA: sulfite exporter TauE/SafE family protein [Terracidiphilus sp.]|jgi:hypothetical protein